MPALRRGDTQARIAFGKIQTKEVAHGRSICNNGNRARCIELVWKRTQKRRRLRRNNFMSILLAIAALACGVLSISAIAGEMSDDD